MSVDSIEANRAIALVQGQEAQRQEEPPPSEPVEAPAQNGAADPDNSGESLNVTA